MRFFSKTVITMAVAAVMVCIMSLAGCSTANQSGLTKAQQKELRQKEDSLRADIARKAVMDGHFIAIADQITLRNGRVFHVNTGLNYVALNGTDGIVQVASNGPWLGANGLGGVTLKGIASDVKTSFDNKENLSLRMRVIGGGLSGEVTLLMPKGSNRASVQIRGTFSFRQLTMYCTIEPYDGTGVIEGRSL